MLLYPDQMSNLVKMVASLTLSTRSDMRGEGYVSLMIFLIKIWVLLMQTPRVPSSQADFEGSLENVLSGSLSKEALASQVFKVHVNVTGRIILI